MQSVIRVLRIRIRNSSSSSTRIGALLCAHVRMCDRFVCRSGRREGRIALSHVLFSLSLAFVRSFQLVSLGKCLQTSKPISFIIIRSTRKYIPSEQKQQSARGEQSVLRLAFLFFSRRERAFSKRTHTHKRKRHLKESDNDFSRVVYHVSMGILLRRRSLHLQDHLRRLPRSGEHGRRRWVHPRRGTRHPSQPRGERARVRHRMVRVEPVARLERLERVVLVFETVLLHDDCGAVARQELTKFEQSNQHEFIVRTRESSRTRGERARV